MLLEFAVAHDLESKNAKSAIRICKANYGAVKEVEQSLDTASICPTPNHLQVDVPIKVSAKRPASFATTGVLTNTQDINGYMLFQLIICKKNTIFFA
jgi:hypothetical protein